MTKNGIKRLVKLFDHKCGISQTKAARKMKCSQPLINWTLKTKTLIRKRKKTKIPKRTVAQKAKIRPMCRKLYYKYKKVVWILDDEFYFTLTHSHINGNDNFYSSNVELTANDVKFKTKGKFEDKLLVYVII